MKIAILMAAIVLVALAAGTAFAALVFWGHNYGELVHHQEGHGYWGKNSFAYVGCPYLEKLHRGVEPYGKGWYHGFGGQQDLPFDAAPKADKDLLEI